jgi:hypothetical protein
MRKVPYRLKIMQSEFQCGVLMNREQLPTSSQLKIRVREVVGIQMKILFLGPRTRDLRL